MPRQSIITPAVLNEIKALYRSGKSPRELSIWLADKGICVAPSTVYYHLGVRQKQKRKVKGYEDFLREDCIKRNVPYFNRRERDRRMYSA